jgi:uncharacterized membrane protein (UPF0127 family)
MASHTTYVTVGDTKVSVEVAATEAARDQGLSGRKNLTERSGMLFVFENEEMRGFWMKDMNFSLDIIWADAKGRVVTVVENISPDSYPQSYYPIVPAKYALEVPAGFVKAHNIAVGDKIVL